MWNAHAHSRAQKSGVCMWKWCPECTCMESGNKWSIKSSYPIALCNSFYSVIDLWNTTGEAHAWRVCTVGTGGLRADVKSCQWDCVLSLNCWASVHLQATVVAQQAQTTPSSTRATGLSQGQLLYTVITQKVSGCQMAPKKQLSLVCRTGTVCQRHTCPCHISLTFFFNASHCAAASWRLTQGPSRPITCWGNTFT